MQAAPCLFIRAKIPSGLNKEVEGPAETGSMWVSFPTRHFPAALPHRDAFRETGGPADQPPPALFPH